MALSRRAFLENSAKIAVGFATAPILPAAYSRTGSAATGCGSLSKALRALANDIDGRLLLPCDPEFAAASQIHNSAADGGPPIAVLEAANASDVARGIAFARNEGIPLAGRNGGHSYAGYSSTTGLQISFAHMKAISVDSRERVARISAGASLFDAYSSLSDHGLLIPGGSCPSVGIAGITLGGGFGLSGRQFGLLSDNLQSATIVTADGQLRTADASSEPDLFWALRGGGGGNFGLVTKFTFQTHPVADVVCFNLNWDWSKVREVFNAWQRMIAATPDELTTICTLFNHSPRKNTRAPTIATVGQFRGNQAQLREILQPLYSAGGDPVDERLQQKSFIDAVYHFAGCKSPAQCRNVKSTSFYIKSAYARQPYPEAAIDELADWIERWPGTSGATAFEFDSYGGVVNRVPRTATAFVHRDQLFVGQFQAYWNVDEFHVANVVSWLKEFYEAMGAYGSGFAYQNYIDRDLANWQVAYYGENLARLKLVKRKYDPDDLFRFAQSIPIADD